MKKILLKNNLSIVSKFPILQNCTIDEVSIITAGEVVTKNIEPYFIVRGIATKLTKNFMKNIYKFIKILFR